MLSSSIADSHVHQLPDELLIHIFHHVICPKTPIDYSQLYHTVLRVCKRWYLLVAHSDIGRQEFFRELELVMPRFASTRFIQQFLVCLTRNRSHFSSDESANRHHPALVESVKGDAAKRHHHFSTVQNSYFSHCKSLKISKEMMKRSAGGGGGGSVDDTTSTATTTTTTNTIVTSKRHGVGRWIDDSVGGDGGSGHDHHHFASSHELTCDVLIQLLNYMKQLNRLEFQFACPVFCPLDDLLDAIIAVQSPSLTHLSLFTLDLNDGHVERICNEMRLLRSVNFWGANLKEHALACLSSTETIGPQLESLSFGSFGQEISLPDTMSNCTSLRELNIGRCIVSHHDLAVLPPTIQKLNVDHCPQIKDCLFIAQHLRHLVHLSISRAGGDTIGSSLPHLTLLSHTLQHLNMRDVLVNDEQFVATISALTRLKSLDMTNCSNITEDAMLLALGNGDSHPHLTSLRMQECYCVDDRVCLQLLSNLSLETLIVTIPRISDETAIETFCASESLSRSLKHLEIYYPRQLTNRAIWSLVAVLRLEKFVLSGFSRKKITWRCLLEFPRYQKRLQSLVVGQFRDHSTPEEEHEEDVFETYVLPLERLETLTHYKLTTKTTMFCK